MEERARIKKAQFDLIKGLRLYFENLGFQDVLTPPMVSNPGMETHLHPFGLRSAQTKSPYDLYLHTSPEFHMKELLSEGFKNIFTISYVFRDEPNSQTHRPQFLMIEWYRTNEYYLKLIEDIKGMIKFVVNHLESNGHQIKKELKNFEIPVLTMREVFQKYLEMDLYEHLDRDRLYNYIKTNHPEIPLYDSKEKFSFDDCFFLLFLNYIEPRLNEYPFIVIKEFPHQLSALSTIKSDDPNVCERFELYAHGVEIANAFNELTLLDKQKARFAGEAKNKKELYNYELPEPTVLYNALERGLPKSTGIALGVERLLASLLDLDNPFWI